MRRRKAAWLRLIGLDLPDPQVPVTPITNPSEDVPDANASAYRSGEGRLAVIG